MSRRRYRGSVVGVYVPSTTTSASGVWDLDTQFSRLQKSAWPAGVSGLYITPARAIFGFGITSVGGNATALNTTNLVSTTGVIATDVTYGAGYQVRGYVAAAGWGLDKALFYGGAPTGNGTYNNVNLVNNSGTMSADETTLASTPNLKEQAGGATVGFTKAVISFGYNNPSGSGIYLKNCLTYSDTGVWANDNSTTIARYHQSSRSTGYGNDVALVHSGQAYTTSGGAGGTGITCISYLSNTGTVSGETDFAGINLWYSYGFATRYGVDTALLLYTNSTTASENTYAYVTNTGVIGSDTQITLSRMIGGATTYSGGNAIMFGGLATNIASSLKLYVTNTGTIGTTSSVAGVGGRGGTAGAGYSLP